MSITVPNERPNHSADAVPVEGDAAALREAAIARLKRKRKFVQDAVAFVTVNGVIWLIWALSDRSTDGSVPWPAWVSMIWGFLLAIDAWRAYGRSPGLLHRPITEEDIRREMTRSRSG